MAILEVKNIEKHFGNTKVLQDVSFSLEEGNALAIIGSSGSGKTTLLRCLNFLETPNGERSQYVGRNCLMRQNPLGSARWICVRSGCISAWCSSPLTCFHSIQHWRM